MSNKNKAGFISSNSFSTIVNGFTYGSASGVWSLSTIAKQVADENWPGAIPSTYGQQLWSWGRNVYGLLGINDTSIIASSPINVGTFNFIKLNTGFDSVFATNTAYNTVAWGRSGTNNKLATNTPTNISPTIVTPTSKFKVVSSGYKLTHALNINGEIFSSGDNTILYNTPASNSFVSITTTDKWDDITVGYNFAIAIRKSDSTLWGWGSNNYGAIGPVNSQSPVLVTTISNWKKVYSPGRIAFGIKNDGSLWSWGFAGNYGAQAAAGVGLSGGGHIKTPTNIISTLPWSKVSFGHRVTNLNHALGIKSDGTLWSWGRNNYGQIGDGTTLDRSIPVQIGIGYTWKQIAAGEQFSMAIRSDGTLWSWGRNNYGQLGLNNTVNRSFITQVGTATNWKNIKATTTTSIAVRST